MNRISFWAAVAIMGLAAAAAMAATRPQPIAKHQHEAARYRQRMLTGPNGQFDGRQYQNALRARTRMLAQHAAATRSWLSAGATPRATAASVINWTEIGPGNVGGRINAIWIDPKNAQHMIVGAAGGGLWQSNDGGSSWTAIAEFPGALAVGAIAQLPNGTLLVGTGDRFGEEQPGDGMFMSTDGGTTWTPIASTAPRSNRGTWSVIESIGVSSTGIVLAATWGGVYRSADGGKIWSKVARPSGAKGISQDIAFDPNNSMLAIADTGDGSVMYSTDSGVTWVMASGLPGTSGARTSLAFDPSVAGSAYALVDNNAGSSPSGEVFHSTDGGQTWSLLAGTGAFVNQVSGSAAGALCDNSFSGSPECQGWYDNVIGVFPQATGKPPVIVVGGIDIFSSTDGGSTWTETGSAYGSANAIHADQHSFAFDAMTGTLFAGNDGGLFKAPVSGGKWTTLNNGLAITQFYSASGHASATASKNKVAGVPITPILAGAQDNGMLLYEGYSATAAPQPNNWVAAFGGDGGFALVDPADGNDLYGEYVYLQPEYSVSGGPSLNFFTSSPPDNASSSANFIAPLALVPNGSQAAAQMLAGGASLWLGSSIQSGSPTWSAINGSTLPIGSSNNYISAIGVDPANSGDVWVGFNNGQVWHSSKALSSSVTWAQMGVGTLPSNMAVTSFWVVPGSPNTVYVTLGDFAGIYNQSTTSSNNVFVSHDGGQTWNAIGTGLPPGPVYSLLTNPSYPQILYVGTLTGIYTSIDGGQSWYASSQGPANISVNQLSWFDTSNPQAPVLLAATYGRGAWLGSPVYNPTPVLTAITPTQVMVGAASTTITLTGTGLSNGSAVTLDNASISSTYLSSSQLQVTVPAVTLSTIGTHTFVITNPIPGGGTSAGASLAVAYPAPTVASLSPASVVMGAAGFTITVTGSGFQPVSTVQWNGKALSTSYVSGTSLTATVPAADLVAGGNATVSIVTPSPGGGTATATFAVDYPMPTLTRISPTSVQNGSASLVITATGSGFVATSTINWNGVPLSTTHVSTTRMTAVVPAGDFTAASSATVTAVTPAPGGGTTRAVTFSVTAPPPPGGGGGALGEITLLLLAGFNLIMAQSRRRLRMNE